MGRKLVFRLHALQRMAERHVSTDEVRTVVEANDVIESYPDDQPYPSRLMLGRPGGRPLHVVAADNTVEDETIIITVYEPEPGRWLDDLSRRRG